jgi:hypothetical protein
MKYKRLIATTTAVMLAAGAATAQTVFQPGVLRYQVWGSTNPNGAQNPSRATINAGLAGGAELDSIDLTTFEAPADWNDNYGSKVSGLFIPATTGKYVFFICADDDADLFLNPDGQVPGGKRLIAQETQWSGRNQWLSTGAGPAAQKRSDQWTNANGAQPWKDGIQLTAGQRYWIEATHHEGGGGDNLSVNFKLVGENDPANGSVSKLTGNLIGYGYSIPANLEIKANLTNKTAYAGSPVTFTFDVVNPVPDPLVFVWKRNGTVIPGVAGPNYTFLATAADNGAVYTAEATVDPSYSSSAKATSASATLTVNAGVVLSGYLKAETYNGQPLNAVRDGSVPGPNRINMWATFEGPVDQADNYTRRVSGHFIAPTTGNYVFMINTDDNSYLYLNPNGTDPAGKVWIAQETGWSGSRNWETGGNLVQKNSSTFVNPDDNSMPGASGFALTQGQKYYIEAIHNEGGGGDNLAVTYFMLGDPVPTNGAPPAVGGSNVEMLAAPITKLDFTTQPANMSVFVDQAAQFNSATEWDGEITPNYQWYRTQSGTTTAITGATGNNYRLNNAALADNGAQFYVVATSVTLTTTSSIATLTVQAAVFEPGWVKMEYWPGETRANVNNGVVGEPQWTRAIEGAEYPDFADNYAARMSGLFIPPSTGRYVFFVCADDDTDLFMNTSGDSPAGKRLIAQESGWSGYRNWTGVGGGSTAEQKRSDSFTPDGGTTYPGASGYQLTGGQKYYFEVVHHEGGGGDNAAVTWIKYGDPDPAVGEPSRFTNSVVGFNAPKASSISFTRQPQSATANIGDQVTFSAEGVSDSVIYIGRAPSTQTVMYQWYKNNTAIPGATGPTYTTPMIQPADVGTTTYKVAIRSLGIAEWLDSNPVTLTVAADTVAPTINVAVSYEVTTIDGLTTKYIGVGFSEIMDTNSLATATYAIPGATITGTEPNAHNSRSVRLTYTGTPTGPVSVTGAKDLSGNTIAAASSKPITALALKGSDIGAFGDPAMNGMMWVDDEGAVTIAAHGTDIWNAADGFFFAYEQKTGDFDVVVRQKSITKTSNWSKGGLMVRETLLPESRNWNIVNDPLSTVGGTALDGSGAGANVIESNMRPATGVASTGFDDIPRDTPPAYPNAWVRVKRVGQVITTFYGNDGVTWRQAGSRDVTTVGENQPLPNTVYVGICVTAHNDFNNLNYNWSDFAGYNSSYVAAPPRPTMTWQRTADQLTITYTGTLQSSDTVDGTYTDVQGATSPYNANTATGNKYFRSRN